MAPRATSGVILLALPFALLHCAEAPEASPAASGPQLAIDVAALSLEGVGDVIWDL